jgi:hypothetical protein
MNEPKRDPITPVTESPEPKLQLDEQELRQLDDGELADVEGGGPIGLPPATARY